MASDKPTIDPVIRLLLVGRTGHGKSETGNSILRSRAFLAKNSAKSVTRECCWKEADHDGTRIEIVDTPGLKDTVVDEVDIKRELYRALIFSSPGFHAIALVIKPERFTGEMKQVVNAFFDFFGNDVEKYAFVIFTHIDTQSELMDYFELNDGDSKEISNNDSDDFIADDKLNAALTKNGYKIDKSLKELIDKCGGNIAFINNRTRNEEQKQQQVDSILNTINEIKRRTKDSYFSNAKFQSIDKMTEIENGKATKAKEQGIEYVPWSWLRPENSQDVLQKLLQDVMDKEKEKAEQEERERNAFEEQQSAKEKALEEQLKRVSVEREKEQKEWEEEQRKFNKTMKKELERMETMNNKLEIDRLRKEAERHETEMQMQREDRDRYLKEMEQREHERREHEAKEREREKLEFESKMKQEAEKARLERCIQRMEHEAQYKSLKEEVDKSNSGMCSLQ